MRILLLGKTGQLGWELQRTLSPLGEVRAWDLPDLDLSNPRGIREIIHASHPHLIVNATAYTAVDQAEDQPDLAAAINAEAPGVMAEEASKLRAGVIHFSTDYVFDGALNRPYSESDEPNPLSTYGRTKLEGEKAIRGVGGAYLIFRTSWVYSLRRKSFVSQVLQWARSQEVMRIASDQCGSPTWCRMLAEATALVIARSGPNPVEALAEKAGLYHLAGSGAASRLEWAKLILALDPRREEQVVRDILPAPSIDFPSPAQRPLFSALDCALFERTFGLQLPDWKETLLMAMAEL